MASGDRRAGPRRDQKGAFPTRKRPFFGARKSLELGRSWAAYIVLGATGGFLERRGFREVGSVCSKLILENDLSTSQKPSVFVMPFV